LKRDVPVVLENGAGIVTIEVYEEEGRMICGIFHIEGWLVESPKRWLKTMRSELARIEGIAKAKGCVEMRFVGRFSQKMFPDYETYEPALSENGLRKVL
jgi:hypothetical protein